MCIRDREKAFGDNIDQHVRCRIENPQVIFKEDVVENDEVFGEVCGYDGRQNRQDAEEQPGAQAEGRGQHAADLSF